MLRDLNTVAERLGGVSVMTIRREIRRGRLRATRVGTLLFVADDEVDDYIRRNTAGLAVDEGRTLVSA
jgi:excisionase family DNA binding protein